MKIIEKKKINEGHFMNSDSEVNKFFKEIDYASSSLVLGGPTESIDDSLEELSKLFGRYVARVQDQLVKDFDKKANLKPQELAQLFLKGFKLY